MRKQLKDLGVDPKIVLDFIKITGNNKDILRKLKKMFGKTKGLTELEELLKYAKWFGIDKKLKIDLSLVRGLDYYTGVVFEVYLGAKVSCGGGGRYDNLIKTISGKNIPATGISLGIDRILEVIKQKNIPIKTRNTKVFVANVNETTRKQSIELVQRLRREGISAQIDLSGKNLRKFLSDGIPS